MILALTAALLSVTPQEFIEGAEIGNADGYVAFEFHGKYHAESVDKLKGKTTLRGSWAFKGESTVEVKLASCKGPACKDLSKPYSAQVAVVAERAMTIKASPADAMLPTGSYYCRYQGCEKRTGVELVSRGAKAMAMNYLLDFMIDKNRRRDLTVVWWAPKAQAEVPKSRIEFCPRDAERGRKGAELVAGDLAELPWVGKLEITEAAERDCLFDVRVYLADSVTPPAKVR